MGTTTNYSLPYPDPTDPVADGAQNFQDLANSLDTLLGDGSPMFIDEANSRLGINDATPSYALDVTGDINATGDLRIGGTTVGVGTAYAPSHTNITVGNGIENARYVQVNELVLVTYALTWGSTTSFGGVIQVGLPLTAAQRAWGSGLITEAGVSNLPISVSVAASASKAEVRPHNISGSFARWDTNIDATNPFTWGTNDQLQFSIVYEVA